MAQQGMSLADEFLNDLEDLDSDDEEQKEEGEDEEFETAQRADDSVASNEDSLLHSSAGLLVGKGKDWRSTCALPQNVTTLVKQIASYQDTKTEDVKMEISDREAFSRELAKSKSTKMAPLPNELLVQCVQAAAVLEERQIQLKYALQDLYGVRFPELNTLVFAPQEYAKVVALLQNDPKNQCKAYNKELGSFLPPNVSVSLAIAASTTSGHPLSDQALSDSIHLSKVILEFGQVRSNLLHVVASSAAELAPNCVALLNSSSLVAALVAAAGSLQQLAMIPGCNLQVLGANKKRLNGMSSIQSSLHEGLIYLCDLVSPLPTELRRKCARVVAAKLALAARIDLSLYKELRVSPNEDKSDEAQHDRGLAGRAFRSQIEEKMEQWQAPPPGKSIKPLPVPDANELKKKRRGGRRARKWKELHGRSEAQKQANRMAFGEAEPTYGFDDEEGLGALVSGGVSKSVRRVNIKDKGKESVLKAANRQIQKMQQRGAGGSGARDLGLTSTINFENGILELGVKTPAPDVLSVAQLDKSRPNGTESVYFSAATPFRGLTSERKS